MLVLLRLVGQGISEARENGFVWTVEDSYYPCLRLSFDLINRLKEMI
jgi:hypothetical protein